MARPSLRRVGLSAHVPSATRPARRLYPSRTVQRKHRRTSGQHTTIQALRACVGIFILLFHGLHPWLLTFKPCGLVCGFLSFNSAGFTSPGAIDIQALRACVFQKTIAVVFSKRKNTYICRTNF